METTNPGAGKKQNRGTSLAIILAVAVAVAVVVGLMLVLAGATAVVALQTVVDTFIGGSSLGVGIRKYLDGE